MTLEIQVLAWDKHENVAGFCSRIILFKIEIYRIISVLKVEIYFITSTVVSLIDRSIMHVKTFETDVFVFICKMKMCLTSHRVIIFIFRVWVLIFTISLSEKCINYWESKIVFIYKSYIRKMYSQRFDETSLHKKQKFSFWKENFANYSHPEDKLAWYMFILNFQYTSKKKLWSITHVK
jgi:hypothetical protein